MPTSFAQPILQLFDDYGEVLALGTITSYEAGTTTPLATYQDLAGNTANQNPTELDAAGRATIRLTDGVAYKFVIKDADGNTIETLDNITVGAAASATTESYLVHMTYQGTPGAQGFMGGHIFLESVQFPIDFEGADGAVQTSPGASYTVSVRKNDVEVGTIEISTAGAFTFETTSHVTVTYAAGDKLTFIAPDSVGTAADFTVTIEGTVQ